MVTIIVSETTYLLDLKSLPPDQIQALEHNTADLQWDREGEIRDVPRSIIENVLAAWWEQLEVGRLVGDHELVPGTGLITWNQAEPTQSTSREVIEVRPPSQSQTQPLPPSEAISPS